MTRLLQAVALLGCGILTGCAAVTDPVADGVPVRLMPPELLGPSKAGLQTIPLHHLRQPPAHAYLLAPGDVLGVYIDGYVGDRNQPLPLHVPPLAQVRDQHKLPPASGYPVPVHEDGTITLPSIAPLVVEGLTLAKAREAIRDAYIKKDLIRPENERISVTLLHPRQVQVLVLRQESSSFVFTPEGAVASGKRNSGHLVDLPAYQNDVLHALAQTGGLPEFDAFNEIIIHRGGYRDQYDKACFEKLATGREVLKSCPAGETIRIPLRLPPGAPLPFRLDDLLLRTGDVVFLEARDEQVFFTAGLLPPGKHMLPRDQDLDVLEAVAQVRGPLFNGAFGGSNLSGTLISPGIGNPSPTLLAVVRRVPGHGQVHIMVDLRRALRDPTERIRIQPGDVLILQEKPTEALVRYFTQTFFNFDVFWRVVNTRNATGAISISAPNQLPSRLGTVLVNP